MSKKYFVVSDLHSYYTITKKCLEEKCWDDDNKEHILIVCGDAFDRGYETNKMFYFLLKLQEQDRLIYIKGNHDELMIDLCDEISYSRLSIQPYHISNGTLQSFFHLCGRCEGLHLRDISLKVRNKFCALYNNMLDYYELGKYIFVHGWIPTKQCDIWECEYGLIDGYKMIDDWKKGNWSDARWTNGFRAWQCDCCIKDKIIVCGHWHTSYAHYLFHGGSNDDNSMFIDDGIIGLDATTCVSNMINVLVLNEEDF